MCRSNRWSPTIPDPLRRRALLAAPLAAWLPGLSGARAAPLAEAFADGASILVAGPAGGRLERCADSLLPLLARGLPGGVTLRRESVGGVDGVTGCNQFQARVAPDGATVLLLPGDAPLAWLVGDPRAQFDSARFIPVLAGVAPAVLVSRRPLATRADAPLRVAAARPDSPDLAGLLALDLLGVAARPTFGLSDAAALSALNAKAVDALLLTGPDAPGRAEALAREGVQPVLSLGVPDTDGAMRRDAQFADIPTLPEVFAEFHGHLPAGPRHAAWLAVAMAAQTDFLMVLQSPTPAAMVALWRQAGQQAVAAPLAPRMLACPALNRFAAPLAAETPVLFALRRWLADRWNWQPA